MKLNEMDRTIKAVFTCTEILYEQGHPMREMPRLVAMIFRCDNVKVNLNNATDRKMIHTMLECAKPVDGIYNPHVGRMKFNKAIGKQLF